MRSIFAGMLVLTLLGGLANADESPTSTVTFTAADGQTKTFTGSKDLAVKFWLQQLAVSALYRNDLESATSSEWDRAVSSPSKIRGVYPAESHIALPERHLVTFEEIVVAITGREWPDFIYLRDGDHYSRLAKYDPWVFWKLKVELGLADKIPETLPRALF
jgi:hypothetical protein